MSKEALDHINANQTTWRQAKRGLISRPHELPQIGNLLHRRITRTFGLDEAKKPLLVWSVVYDNPQTPNSEYVYERRYPEGIEDTDKKDYVVGIERINEYATNYATKEFIRSNADFPVGKQAVTAYGAIADLLTYGVLLNGTYQVMRDLEIMANHQGLDYKTALLDGLFNHDFQSMNGIIQAASEYTGLHNLTELATEIGRRRFKKPDLGKWLGKLDTNKSDGPAKAAIKNCLISVAAGGVFRTPGVVEMSAGMIPFAAATNFVASDLYVDYNAVVNMKQPGLILNPEIPIKLAPLVAESTLPMILVAGSLLPFIAIHESIHHYSGSQDYLGFIPVSLIEKRITPAKAKLEGE